MSDAEVFTPTEELLLEVLAARYRLGERIWTFNNNSKKTALKLESRGLVSVMSGIVEKTYRASLTEAGRGASLDPNYEPPFKKDLKKSRRRSW